MGCGLCMTPRTVTYTQNGHGGGRGEAVANPQNGACDHGANLVVHGHAEVREELDGHADARQVGNWDLQLAREPRIHPELEHHADDTLDDDQCAMREEREKQERVHQRGRAEEVREIDSVARLESVSGPAHAELEGEAETHGACDVDLRAIERLHLLLVLVHYPSTRLASPTLDARLLRLTTLNHGRVGLLQQE